MEAICGFCAVFTLIIIPFVLYKLLWRQSETAPSADLYCIMKRALSKRRLVKIQKSLPKLDENINPLSDGCRDQHLIYALDCKGNSLILKFLLTSDGLSEIALSLTLQNGSHYSLPNQRTQLYRTSSCQWKNKCLRLDVLEPFRRIRVCYNGLLSNGKQLQHVQFKLMWSSASAPFFYPNDAHPGLLFKNQSDLTSCRGYEQFGAIFGEVRGGETFQINLPSVRKRVRVSELATEQVNLFVALRNGCLFSIALETLKNGSKLQYGQIISGSYETNIISECNLEEIVLPSDAFTLHVNASSKTYKGVFHTEASCIATKSRDCDNILTLASCEIGTKLGKAVLDVSHLHNNRDSFETPPSLISAVETSVNVDLIDLDAFEARDVKLTGGKASSLALLRALKSDRFDVPNGFAVTVKAFDSHVETSGLADAIDDLVQVFCGSSLRSREAACQKAVDLFQCSRMSAELYERIRTKLADSDDRWAVRSSGVTEDGEEISAAGQNDTFLGCLGHASVIRAVIGCWASLFTYQSVQYRHQHGLPIRTQMAVVVQRMVDAQCAGVLFTANPVSGNPAQSIVTANHGLGESVVSGRSDPDTIIVEDLNILSKTIGRKDKIIQQAAAGGIEEVTNDNKEVSLSDERVLRLVKVGKWLEEQLGGSRDIEWAYTSDNLFLLQARPITTLDGWNESELAHEFDTPTLSDDVAVTVANTGEVYPGATSLLTQTTVVRILDRALQRRVAGENNVTCHINRMIPTFRHRVFIDTITSLYKNVEETIPAQTLYVDLAVFGHPVLNEKINNMAAERLGYVGRHERLKELLTMIKFALKNDTLLKRVQNIGQDCQVGLDETTDDLMTIYRKIDDFLASLYEVFYCHCVCTGVSVFYQIVALTILAGEEKLAVDHYNDVAAILSSCDNVTGAEIPEMLSSIVEALARDGLVDEFLRTTGEQARTFLHERCRAASDVFEQFLVKHGHRCLGEFDLSSSTWGTNPEQVFGMIRANCKIDTSKRGEKVVKTTEEVANSLKTVKSKAARKILQFLMGKIRKTVGVREQSKSEVIRMVDKLRNAYKTLGRNMATAGIIPDEKLIFHFAHHEVLKLIRNDPGAPNIITKALQRQRLYPKWDQDSYDEICFGIPQPNAETIITGCHGDVRVNGTPICNGVIKARACVINTLDHIDQLKNGDILITYCTDIGWSPYFPMLAGIVTELGGLVSHGAVIAREYGLPSIVGATNVTKVFKTGDVVLLSGDSGYIDLVSRED